MLSLFSLYFNSFGSEGIMHSPVVTEEIRWSTLVSSKEERATTRGYIMLCIFIIFESSIKSKQSLIFYFVLFSPTSWPILHAFNIDKDYDRNPSSLRG